VLLDGAQPPMGHVCSREWGAARRRRFSCGFYVRRGAESPGCGWRGSAVPLGVHKLCELKDGLCRLIGVLGCFRAGMVLVG
jgi:hypothetical protein